MKKISRWGREKWSGLSRRRAAKHQCRQKEKRRRASLRGLSATITVSAPRLVMLEHDDAHFELTSFLSKLRRRLREGTSRILLDFTKTEQIFPGGGLLMYSEFQRLTELFPSTRFLCRESRSDRVNQVLQYLDIYRMFKHNSKAIPRRSDVTSWRHARADEIDCTGAGRMIEAYSALSKPVAKLLFKAASEAISNTINHAYGEPRGDGLPEPRRKNWWMFCREDQNKFYMSVCDLGVGIPRTLTVKNAEEVVTKILEKISAGLAPNDAQMIMGAMEYARTRTRRPQQGKGLLDLRRIIEEQGAGRLYVFSNRGCVMFDAKHGYQLVTYKKSIRGTLVVWSVPIENETRQ